MADHTIFYSWQTDSPDDCNRDFIRTAIQAVSKERAVLDAPRFESGMKGIAGSPEVATVMFDKIRSAAIFLGDVTLSGSAKTAKGEIRRMPNSNVAVEMGYAAGVLGWERVICVMNTYYGKPEEQPFDVRNRRFPITYELAPDADGAVRKEALRRLAKDYRDALKGAEIAELAAVERAVARLDAPCLRAISLYGKMSYFAEHSEFAQKFGPSIVRLLDLGIIFTDVAEGRYAYHWTYLGERVIKKAFPIHPAIAVNPIQIPLRSP